ncbi:hypothetical protein MTO96_024683 [Rhipicephalus appendiculatus]
MLSGSARFFEQNGKDKVSCTRDALYTQVQMEGIPPGAKKKIWRKYFTHIDESAEGFWRTTLRQLRESKRAKVPAPKGRVYTAGDIALPDFFQKQISDILFEASCEVANTHLHRFQDCLGRLRRNVRTFVQSPQIMLVAWMSFATNFNSQEMLFSLRPVPSLALAPLGPRTPSSHWYGGKFFLHLASWPWPPIWTGPGTTIHG